MAFCWQSAKHRVVRELGWSLFSPPLLHHDPAPGAAPWAIGEDEEASWLLADADRHPAPLEKHLDDHPDQRLGARFEALWQFFLQRHSFYTLHAANLQINGQGRTLGALDLLLEDHHRGEVIHLELAVKFYLHYRRSQEAARLADWIGPNPDDNLAIKVSHLLCDQLPLSELEQARAAIRQRGLPLPTRRVGIMKGYLFSPPDDSREPGPPVNAGHLRGRWCHRAQLAGLQARYPGLRWGVVDRNHWLDPSPAVADSAPRVASRLDELPGDQPQLLVARDNDRHSGEYGARVFVAPDGWPEEMKSSRGSGDPEGT